MNNYCFSLFFGCCVYTLLFSDLAYSKEFFSEISLLNTRNINFTYKGSNDNFLITQNPIGNRNLILKIGKRFNNIDLYLKYTYSKGKVNQKNDDNIKLGFGESGLGINIYSDSMFKFGAFYGNGDIYLEKGQEYNIFTNYNILGGSLLFEFNSRLEDYFQIEFNHMKSIESTIKLEYQTLSLNFRNNF